jgi:TIR domain
MQPTGGVFVNYRRDDTGWAANIVADALRRRLGATEVFLDNRSIRLGQAFPKVLEEGLRRSAVLVVLIGPRWDVGPPADRLADPADWVRREIVLAEAQGSTIVPVLVDRTTMPDAHVLPADLRFLRDQQAAQLRQHDDRDPETFADRIAALLPDARRTAPPVDGVERTRPALDELLRFLLPPAQQWSGNRDRLLDLALAVLGRDDRLIFLAPARIHDGPRGSATVFVTASDVLVVEVGENFRITGEIRFPRALIRRVEVVPTVPLFADAIVHTASGDEVRLQGLFRDQARQLADHLRG